MNLSSLIRGKKDFATATVATAATVPPFSAQSAAIVATVAVANPEKTKTAPLSSKDETAIRAWLAVIGEADLAVVREVIDSCRRDPDVREYFLQRAKEPND